MSIRFRVGTSLLYATSLSAIFLLLSENLLRWRGKPLVFNNQWFNLLWERVVASDFCVFMLIVFNVLLFYAILQLLGVSVDKLTFFSTESKPSLSSLPWYARIIMPLTGRVYPVTIISLFNQDQNFQQQRDISYDIFMTPLSFGIWVMPLLGFIGTVVGVSGAIAELPQLQSRGGEIGGVLSNLYVAFDTTFIGLVCAIILAILQFVIQIRWRALDYLLLSPEITNNTSSKT